MGPNVQERKAMGGMIKRLGHLELSYMHCLGCKSLQGSHIEPALWMYMAHFQQVTTPSSREYIVEY